MRGRGVEVEDVGVGCWGRRGEGWEGGGVV